MKKSTKTQPLFSPATSALLVACQPNGHADDNGFMPEVAQASDEVIAAMTDVTGANDAPENLAIEAARDLDTKFIKWSLAEDSLKHAYEERQKLVNALEAAGLDAEQMISDVIYSGAGYGFTIGLVVGSRIANREWAR